MPSPLRRLTQTIYATPTFLLVLCAIFWAGNAIAGRLAVGEISPFLLVFLRWLLVLAVLWPVYGGDVRANWPVIRPKIWRIILMASIGFTAFNALYYIAARYTTAINLGILQGAMPVFVLAGAFVAHGTHVTLKQTLGVFITIIGVAVVATQGNPSTILNLDLNRGDLGMLACCVLYAYYAVAIRNRPQMPGAAFFTLLAMIAAASSIPLVAAEYWTGTLAFPTGKGWLITAYVAIFPSCLAQIFFLRGVDLIGPGRAGVFLNLVPVFAPIMAVALIHEPFEMFHGLALALVLGGIWLAQSGPSAPTASPTAKAA